MLTTVLVVDAGGSYRKVAFMVCDKEDALTTELLLQCLKGVSPDRHLPVTIVTDDAGYEFIMTSWWFKGYE